VNAIYQTASDYLGLKEWPGARSNPRVVEMFAASGNGWVQDDETPWCAAFVGAVLAQVGLTGTGKLNARSYLDWGDPVDLVDAQRGDIVVFWRGSRDGWQGHVGFYGGVLGNDVLVLGGNQGNAVSVAPYPKARLLGVRRARMPRARVAQSTTIQASVAQVGAAATGGITAVAALDGTAQAIAVGCMVIVGLAAAWIMKERLRAWAAGRR